LKTKKKINKEILRLAIPNIITNLTVPLLSSVDTALMGHLGELYYLGAIAVGGIIFNFVYWGMGFLRMGTTGLTAQAFGEKNDTESVHILVRALLTSLGLSILIILLRGFIVDISFFLIDATPQVEIHAREYYSIRILAAPSTLGLYVFTGWFLGMQNAKYPLILAIITNVLNIVFNLGFIKIFDMDVDGVAWGTVCANYLGMIVAFLLFYRSYHRMTALLDIQSLLDWKSFYKFFRIGRDIFIRTLILIFSFSFFMAKSAEAGDLILAANSILINLWTIMSFGIDGFAFATESLVGRYIGARDEKYMRSSIIYSFMWGVGLGIIFSLVYIFYAHEVISIFTNQASVIMLALSLMIWTQIAPVISSFSYIWDGIFIGATATGAMRNSMMISLFMFYLPAYFLGRPIFGDHTVWIALTVFMVARGVTLALHYKGHVLPRVTR
jgi:MATE family multidrug resistance protein